MRHGSTERARPQEEPTLAASWIFGASPWLGASVLAFALACAVDVASMPRPLPAAFFAFVLGLFPLVALLHGVCWSLAWLLVRGACGRFAPWLWLGVGVATGLWLAGDLGAYSRLHGRYAQLAILVLVACVLGGLAIGGLFAAFQPTAQRPRGYLPERSAAQRGMIAFFVLCAACALWLADRRLFPGQYRDAHTALRTASLWCAMMALVASRPMLRLPRLTGGRWLLATAGFVACLFTLDERQTTSLQAFGTRPWLADLLQISRTLVDWDRDGYSSLLGGGDCAPWNPRIHPGAREIPDNGIDENCILGDATRKIVPVESLPLPKQPSPLDVVLITVDAFRWDHLGLYNPRYGEKGRATSPNLDRWAKSATVFDHAYTPGAWTSLAIPALMRGVYPRRLRWKKYFETDLYRLLRKPLAPKLHRGEQALRMFPLAFDDPHPALPVMLQRRGMHTAAITDDGFSAILQPGTGLERGFTIFRQVDNLSPEQRNDAGTADLAIAALRQAPRGRRFFLWVHFFGTHFPDEHHPGVRDYGSTLEDRYDHEVAFFDQQVERLLQTLAARPGPVAIFIAADHGEVLTNGVRQHGQTVEESAIRIPLLARVPGWPALRVASLVSSIDLLPTILALTRTPSPTNLDGTDLAGAVSSPTTKPRVLLCDTWRFEADEREALDYATAFDGKNKVVLDRLSGTFYSYDQSREARGPLLSGVPAPVELTRAINAYVEESGGALDLSD